jgi:dihydropteroate synthase
MIHAIVLFLDFIKRKINIQKTLSMLFQQTTLNCNGKLLDLSTPLVMGILNVTPDSFYDGGRLDSDKNILAQTEKMIREGAAIIDIGGVSTRPGASAVSIEEELERTIPVVRMLHKEFPETVLSIDTFRAAVAEDAFDHGVSIINDISAGSFDEKMFSVVGKLGLPYVLMHIQGNPETMQKNPEYKNVVEEVLDFMIAKIAELRNAGVKDIIIDPGFGFGKTVEHNYELLKNLHVFKILELPILVGISRKSMICKVLKVNPKNALNGTTALHVVALQQGAKIIRAHDVKEAMQTIRLLRQFEAL